MENGNPIDPTSRTKSNFRSMFFGKTRLFIEEKDNAIKASVITGAILGDKALFVSDEIAIISEQTSVLGSTVSSALSIKYTIDGSDPKTKGIAYKAPFKVIDGTTVKAIVLQNDKVVLTMEETFGKNQGLFWGDENSADIWIGRGVNIAAEDAILEGDLKVSKNAHLYKGTGFVVFDGKEGSITWYKENDGEAGDFSIRFRYMHNNIGELHPMKLYVNGDYVKTFEFKATGGWEKEWKFVNTIVNFKSGANEIKLETTGQSGPHIDELFVD
jgi:beta-galactosidase